MVRLLEVLLPLILWRNFHQCFQLYPLSLCYFTQGENGTFIVEFDQCPALRKPHLQEVALFDMVAYKDAIRHHVCIGDKVLAPWQNDGRYGPGTVLDGVDRRDVQPQGKLCI